MDEHQQKPLEPATPDQTNPDVSSTGVQQPLTTPPALPESPHSAMEDFPVSQKRPGLIFPIFLFFIFLFVVVVFGAGSYAVAYKKIKLPAQFNEAQALISNFVQGIPFTPKTPEFLLAKSLIAQDTINKESYNISVALDSPGSSLIPGLGSKLDIEAKGAIDYSDTKNVKFTIDANLTKDFSFHLLKPDQILYFNIAKVPSFLLSMGGFKATDFEPILNKWYFYDTTPLQTEARKELEEGDKEVISDKFVKDNINSFVDDKLTSKMKVSDGTTDGFSIYRITLEADANLIDHIGKIIEEQEKKQNGASLDRSVTSSQKLSDIVKSMKWEAEIDKKEYYIRKVAITAAVEVDEIDSYGTLFMGSGDLSSNNKSANIGIVAKFSDFGKDIEIKIPEEAKSWEEFTDTVSEIVRSQYETASINPTRQLKLSRDAVRKQDINTLRSAIELYRADNNAYPQTLDKLLGTYIGQVPKDPASESDYYYKVSTDNLNYDLCATMEMPDDLTLDTCPDPNFNYHLTAPN